MAKFFKSRKKNIIILLVSALTLVIFASVLSGVYAKYVKEIDSGKGVVTSKNMYFESDYLTEKGASYNIASGSTVTFRLMNYPDTLRVSELDVYYEVTVTPAATLSEYSEPLRGNERSFVDITISDMQPGQTYTVTATGKNGYERVLTATFTVSDVQDTVVYKRVTQTEHYVLLTVMTQNVKGEASIAFPSSLIPDKTDPLMSGEITDSTFTDMVSFNEMTYSSHTYRFFKASGDTTAYTAENFNVEVDNTEAHPEPN